jgi:uncharacterized protein
VYRAVLDTNVFVSGAALPRSIPSKLLDAWRGGQFVLVTSPQLLAEAQDVLHRPEIRAFTGLTTPETNRFIADIAERAHLTEGTYQVSRISTDPDDNIVLAAALEGLATHIVTGDTKSLLPLKEYHGIRILQPQPFLSLLRR